MKTFLLFFILFFSLTVSSQVAPNKYYIEFTDKNYNDYDLERPEEFLSERSLQRRANQNIELDLSDLPVTQLYVDSLESIGLDVINVSKWFNSATVYTLDSLLMDTIDYLGFVSNSAKYKPLQINKISVPERYKVPREIISGSRNTNYYNYGTSADQIYMHNGQTMHNNGFRGQGMLIAITDAGFTGLPNLPAFDSLFDAERVLSTRNFVYGGENIFSYSTHGMRVLSILAGNSPDSLIGSAPEANYLLLMSEDPDSENIIEEINWISAAEYADSIGADIINVSLGYLDFDMPEYSHTYQSMDGKTAIISIAAEIASSKGMIIVASAANSGDDPIHPWINAPGDANNILTAGAVWSNQSYAAFSSIGPSYDGRVKPDIVAMGGGTTNQELDGSFGQGNGTSFSSPILSGLIACLWQQFPDKTNEEIMDAVRKSSHLYNSPTDFLGYGIPDFNLAGKILNTGIDYIPENKFSIYPNPFDSVFVININTNPGDYVQIIINDISGKNNYIWMEFKAKENNSKITIDDLDRLKSGIYIINVIINNSRYSEKLIKK
ncbi:MAG: S8 family serine peptidase [Bacteroidales bacterium]|nr:S8 family serine peptidase [Bacteroidales bacterium]MDD3860002.1 S8 family serine peptidase [Bacteroidales bacterium]